MPESSEYVSAVIGEADDVRDADGCDILSYNQAFDKALKWIDRQINSRSGDYDPDMTVSDAVTAYLAVRDARRASQVGRPQRSDASYKLTRHVLEDARLSAVRLADLRERDLRAWQQRLVRREAASRQRIVNDLKAALNAAYGNNREILPPDLPTTIKYGLKVEAPGNSIAWRATTRFLLMIKYAG